MGKDPFSDQNGAKTLPDGAANTYIAYIREYPPPGVFIYIFSMIGLSPANSPRIFY